MTLWQESFGEPNGAVAAWNHRGARHGFEIAWLRQLAGGFHIAGHTTAIEGGVAWSVGYEIDVDQRWRTIRAQLTELLDGCITHHAIESNRAGQWTVDGIPARHVDGCIDIDLESSAVTNTIFLHRVQPSINRAYEATAAYVRCAPVRLERLEQTYRRISQPSEADEIVFEYTAPAFNTSTQLLFDRDGLITHYPGLAQRVLLSE